MTETDQEKISERPQVGNLTDFVIGATIDNPLDVEIAVNDQGRIVIFHDKPFREEIAWFEYDVTQSRLEFIIGEEGEIRDIGMRLAPQISKHMHNTHQILTVLMNDKTGEASEGNYVPLIVHQS